MITIGIDMGGTRIKAAAYDAAGNVLRQTTAPTEDGAIAEDGLPRFAHHIRALIADLETELGAATRIGLAAPGLADNAGTCIRFMPGRMAGLEDFDWSNWLGRPVKVLNDAHAALLGEVWLGAARGFQHAMLLTLGTGVGGAVWADGRLLRGCIGRAGHLGHICLDPDGAPGISGLPGSLEDWIGNHNILERTQGRFETTHALVAAYEQGDAFASTVWLRSIHALGCGIASLINVLDPEVVLLGGGIATAERSLFEPIQRVLDAVEWRPAGHRVRLLPTHLGEWAGTAGAASPANHVS